MKLTKRGFDFDSIVVAAPTAADFKAHEAKCQFTLRVHGQRIPFETLNEASGILCEMRAEACRNGMGVHDFGSRFSIVDKKGKEVAHVSYNGCIWQGKVCIFDPSKDLCVS